MIYGPCEVGHVQQRAKLSGSDHFLCGSGRFAVLMLERSAEPALASNRWWWLEAQYLTLPPYRSVA